MLTGLCNTNVVLYMKMLGCSFPDGRGFYKRYHSDDAVALFVTATGFDELQASSFCSGTSMCRQDL